MKVYLIMPVRAADPYWTRIAESHREALEARGDEVHYPPRDAPQDCPTGRTICETHRAAMLACDEVHVLWDVDSKGSHFDLGMAYALGKTIVPIGITSPDGEGKSYWKAVITPDRIDAAIGSTLGQGESGAYPAAEGVARAEVVATPGTPGGGASSIADKPAAECPERATVGDKDGP